MKSTWTNVAIVAISVIIFCVTFMVSEYIKEYNSGVTHFYYDVTLYADNGSVIKEWKASSRFGYTSDGFATFYDADGKKVKVSGTVVLEQLQ